MNAPAVTIRTMEDTSNKLSISVLAGYAAVILTLAGAWALKDENVLRAKDGLGYWLGIVGATLMLLLLVYPLRKRLRALSALGSVRFWFRTHMIFGILGPVLVLLHSNFNLGSLNGQIALYCTLVVATSGILGRYLYGKIHYGMYGQRATLESLQGDSIDSDFGTGILPVTAIVNAHLQSYEAAVMDRARRVLPSVIGMLSAPFTARRLTRKLDLEVTALINERASESALVADHRDRLLAGAHDYVRRRLTTYRKFAQLKGCERLFSLWHIVHFPLFLVMVVAAIIHVAAVHAY